MFQAKVQRFILICHCEKVSKTFAHADIHFGWGYVVIELTTHDENAITMLDVELATKINAIGG